MRFPPAPPFLRRLKTKLDDARQLTLPLFEDPRGAQQHGRMAVVSAGMHSAGVLAPEGYVRLFLDGQRVHIRPQQDAPGLSASHRRHDSRLGDPGFECDPQASKLFGHEPGGCVELVEQLRASMQAAANIDDPRLHGFGCGEKLGG